MTSQSGLFVPSETTAHKETKNSAQVLPLENGDRLTRDEFERRYQTMSNVKKAELIEGVVYMPSPVRITSHGRPHAYIITWLGTYVAATPGVDLADNATVRLDLDNEPQPDALLRVEAASTRTSMVDEDEYVQGAPELVVEIAASSVSYDLHDKMNAYRRNGVQEYLVWRMYERQITWLSLQAGVYTPLSADDNGMIRSRIFSGLWLAVPALIDGDLAKVLAELQKGLQTPEHSEFVARLAAET